MRAVIFTCLASAAITAASAAAAQVESGQGAQFYEHDIGLRKAEIAKYRGVIAEQKRASAISGFVDKRTMYAAGVVIDRDQQAIARDYAQYRAVGGRKPLAGIDAIGNGNRSRFDY